MFIYGQEFDLHCQIVVSANLSMNPLTEGYFKELNKMQKTSENNIFVFLGEWKKKMYRLVII